MGRVARSDGWGGAAAAIAFSLIPYFVPRGTPTRRLRATLPTKGEGEGIDHPANTALNRSSAPLNTVRELAKHSLT
jgi:hypothetical protein